MAAPQPDVPTAVEEYLIELFSSAGARGGQVGGGRAGARGGSRGGASAAKRMRTRVERRSGPAEAFPPEIWERLDEELPNRIELPRESGARFAVPIGRTGLQQVVVDLEVELGSARGSRLTLVAYGKEGLLSRRPTRATADRIWAAIAR